MTLKDVRLKTLISLEDGVMGGSPDAVIDLSLERIRLCLTLLANPQDKCAPVIHVAGTNGKGSTIAFMRAMLEAAGKVVHVYTSPHLVTVEERFLVAGKQVESADLHAVQAEVEAVSQAHNICLTPFEGLTASAFLLFSRISADYVLLETGLGGRLDATNVVTRPALTVITKIGLDHQDFLGDTVEQIALEKLGIVRENVPVVIAPQAENLQDFMRQKALERGAVVSQAGADWTVTKTADGGGVLRHEGGMLTLSKPALLGEHQLENAATATIAMLHLGIAESEIQMGARGAVWLGRLQQLFCSALPKGVEVWVDGAHNEDGLRALATQIQAWKMADARPVIVLGGMLKNRDPSMMAAILGPVADALFALETGDLRFHEPTIFKGSEIISIKGLDVFLKNRNNPCRIVVTGSLYLVGMVLDFWNKVMK